MVFPSPMMQISPVTTSQHTTHTVKALLSAVCPHMSSVRWRRAQLLRRERWHTNSGQNRVWEGTSTFRGRLVRSHMLAVCLRGDSQSTADLEHRGCCHRESPTWTRAQGSWALGHHMSCLCSHTAHPPCKQWLIPCLKQQNTKWRICYNTTTVIP